MNLISLRAKALRLLGAVNWFPPLLGRFTIGTVFITSGWGKLHNLPKVIEFFTSLGIPAARLQAPFVASVEFGCGTLVLLGLFTRLASIPLIGTMIVAIITAKRDAIEGWTDLFGLEEFLFIPILIYLIFYGPGKIAIDYFLARRLEK